LSGRAGSGFSPVVAFEGRHRNDLDERLAVIVNALAYDVSLDVRHHDHAL